MENKKWLELIDEKRTELLEAGEQAFKDSVDNQHLKYHVELYKDGSIDTWYDVAGGNSFTQSSWKGDSMVVITFCHQYMEIQVETKEYIEKAIEKGIEIQNIEEMSDVEIFEYINENHNDVIAECEQEYLDWYKNEYAYESTDTKLDLTISMLEME